MGESYASDEFYSIQFDQDIIDMDEFVKRLKKSNPVNLIQVLLTESKFSFIYQQIQEDWLE